MKKRTLLLALLLSGVATVWSFGALPTKSFDWPQWRGPDRTDISRQTGLLTSWPSGGPPLVWTFSDAGLGYSSPAVVGDRLFTTGASKDGEILYAIDLQTRKKVWSVDVGPLFVNGWGDGPRGTPTVDGDLVYALGGQGNLVCVNAETGKKLWTKRMKADLGGEQMSGWGYTESPLVDGNLVLVTPGGNQGAVAAFDKKTGDLKWRSTTFKDKAGYSSLVVGEAFGIRQYVQLTGQSVVGIAAVDGKLLWRFAYSTRTAAIPTPIVKDNYVYVSSGYGTGCALVKLTQKGTGIEATEVYANKDMENHHGGVILVGDHLYGYSQKGGWVCQDFKTGKVVWSNRGVGKGCLTCADGHLYCYGERDGNCALVEASPTGYKETGNFKIPQETKLPRKSGKIWTHPVVSNGKLYLRDQDLIFCYDISRAQ